MKSGKRKVTLSFDSKTYEEFQEYCRLNAILISRKIEIWIEDFLKEVKGGKKR